MAKKGSGRGKARSKAKRRKAKPKKIILARFVCTDCNSDGKGGYFTAASEKSMKCPYCSSSSVKLLG